MTKDVTKMFCPNCGHTTLLKTSISVDSMGNIIQYYNPNRKISTRGTRVNSIIIFVCFTKHPKVCSATSKGRKKRTKVDLHWRSINGCSDKKGQRDWCSIWWLEFPKTKTTRKTTSDNCWLWKKQKSKYSKEIFRKKEEQTRLFLKNKRHLSTSTYTVGKSSNFFRSISEHLIPLIEHP